MNRISSLFVIHVLLAAVAAPCAASEVERLLPPLKESEAYKEYRKRPETELSKILYMIDRFKIEKQTKIYYDGVYYDVPTAAIIARQFLQLNYMDQTAVEWVNEHCTISFFQRKPILIKFPDGTTRLSRRILLQELKDLEKASAEDRLNPPAAAVPAPPEPAERSSDETRSENEPSRP